MLAEQNLGLALGRVLFLRARGPLDGSGAAPERIVARMRGAGARLLLLDTTVAPYADSDGLRWLLRLRAEVEKAGRSLRIVARRGGKVWRNLTLLEVEWEMYGSLRHAWSPPAILRSTGRRLRRLRAAARKEQQVHPLCSSL